MYSSPSDLSFQRLFDRVAVSLWVEDFSAVRTALDEIRGDAGTDYRRYFAEHPTFVDRMVAAVRIVDVNAASVHLFEADHREQLLQSLEHVFTPETRPAFVEELVAFAEGRASFSMETTLRSLKGRRLHVLVSITFPDAPDDSNRIVVSLLDISDRLVAGESLVRAQREENLRRMIAENATLGLFMMDARQHCTYMNHAAERMTGFTFEEVAAQQRPLHDIVHHTRPDGRPYPLAECPIDRALPTRNRQGGEDVFVRKDGSFYPVAFTASPIVENGAPVGTVIEVRETTDDRRVQREIRQAHERLEAALEASSIGTYSWDVRTDAVIHDAGTERLFAFRPGQGSHLEDYTARIHPDERERWIAALERTAVHGDDLNLEYRIVWPDGSTRWCLDKGRVVKDAKGTPLYVSGAVVDITHQKLAEATLRDADRRKDDFLATLSHELRTPLNVILGWTRMLLENRVPSEEQRRALEIVERNARLQVRLVEDVLSVASVTSGRVTIAREPLDLVHLTRVVVDGARPGAAGRNVNIRLHAGMPAVVLGDPARLQQAVGNVLSNALKFTPANGRITVRVTVDGAFARVVIRDSGPGMPHEFLPHAFERFRQADSSPTREHGGLGIGLTIARHLVELHGGSVAARNLPASDGRGLEVEIQLPLHAADPASENTGTRTEDSDHETASP